MNCVVFLTIEITSFIFFLPDLSSNLEHRVSLGFFEASTASCFPEKKCLNSPYRYRHRPLGVTSSKWRWRIFSKKKTESMFFPKSARDVHHWSKKTHSYLRIGNPKKTFGNPWPSQWWMAWRNGKKKPGAWRPNPCHAAPVRMRHWLRPQAQNGYKLWGFYSRSKFENTTLCWKPHHVFTKKSTKHLETHLVTLATFTVQFHPRK